MTRLYNGDIIYPARGKPPPCPPGYTQDEGDGFLFHLDYQPCIYRKNDFKITPCKKKIPFTHCELKVIQVTALICKDCQERKPE